MAARGDVRFGRGWAVTSVPPDHTPQVCLDKSVLKEIDVKFSAISFKFGLVDSVIKVPAEKVGYQYPAGYFYWLECFYTG